jgi:hypothetical protein
LLLGPRAGIDDLLPVAVLDTVIRLAPLAQPVGILGDGMPGLV